MEQNTAAGRGRYKSVTTIIGFLISICFLWLTISSSGLDFRNISFHSEQLPLFILSMLCYSLVNFIHSRRARLFWADLQRSVDTYSGFLIGRFYNSILPGQLGEGFRAWHLSRKNHLKFLNALSSLAVEKWLDGIFFTLCSILIFSVHPFHDKALRGGILFTCTAVIIFSAVFILSIRFKGIGRALFRWIVKIKVVGIASYKIYYYAQLHFRTFLKTKRFYYFMIGASVMFMLNMLHATLLLSALDIRFPNYGIYPALLLSATLMIIGMIPSAPSNIGVMHFGLYYALIAASENLGIPVSSTDLEKFALFTFYFHFSVLIPDLVLGSLAVIKENKWIFRYPAKE